MNDFFFLAGGFAVAIMMALLIIPNILIVSYKRRLFDMPDQRKVHSAPVSRLGGVSFFPVIAISFCLMIGLWQCMEHLYGTGPLMHLPYSYLFMAIGTMLLYLVGVMDDLIGVSYRYKFLVQLTAAALLTTSGTWINSLGGLFGIWEIPAWAGIPLSIFIIIYITNAINLIDGIDGLASGLSSIAIIAMGTLLISKGELTHALLAFCTLGVLLPFWVYNVFGYTRHRHRLFMGDTGSLTLGFIVSYLVIQLSTVQPGEPVGDNRGLIISFSALFIPLVDVIRVVLHRLINGKSPFLPDRNHIHHKLLAAGLPPKAVLLTIILLAILFITANVMLSPRINITVLLAVDLFIWFIFITVINHMLRKRNTKAQQQ
jgi:UDP-GlcNAc:undecaprenyl-phosphate GlcNAc-1-phosphate transferase